MVKSTKVKGMPVRKKAVKRRVAKKSSTSEQSGKKAAVKPSAERLLPQPGELIVRMYRQGLGDCFLLAFATDNPADPRYVLIDCGVHMRQTDGRKRLLQVMEDLIATTGNHLHVVVPTHEHADHLIGFVQKGSPFLKGDQVSIDNLWLAWTEKIGDGSTQADQLRAKRGSARAVIEQAIEKARERANQGMAGMNDLAERIERILEFEKPDAQAFDAVERKAVEARIRSLAEGDRSRKAMLAAYMRRFDPPPATALANAGKRDRASSNELALGLLAMMADPKYCEPGQRLEVPDVAHVRAYVLGPPHEEKLLKQDKPSKIPGGQQHEYIETYLSGGSASLAFALSPALDIGAAVYDDLRYPFAEELRRKTDGSETSLPHLYRNSYMERDSAWRRIDGGWLGSAETVALNLDGDTNNTSLVLAFELGEPGAGPVLLFVGDAQVGNWLSWRGQQYGEGETICTADDLLGRTLLYKVGHHGSHNATVKSDPRRPTANGGDAYGLELMSDIIAMIPVDRAAADKNMPTPWRMPHQPLYQRLREKADRRILRSDERIDPLSLNELEDIKPGSNTWEAVPGKPGLSWRRAAERFRAGTPGFLYYDLRIPIPKR